MSFADVEQFDWPPFIETPNRPGCYSVHPNGVIWLWERLGDYDLITGPEGVPPEEHDERLAFHQRTFRRALASEYLSHHRAYPLEQVLPENPSKSQRRAAEKVSVLMTVFCHLYW